MEHGDILFDVFYKIHDGKLILKVLNVFIFTL
jgi:hypothetical protein